MNSLTQACHFRSPYVGSSVHFIEPLHALHCLKVLLRCALDGRRLRLGLPRFAI